jgi:hypothetical protein
MMGRHQNKLTDLQRAVMQAAGDVDPGKRIVGAQYAQAAKLLAERGYITLQPSEDGFRVELSDLAMRNVGLRTHGYTWRRFPPLPPRWEWEK